MSHLATPCYLPADGSPSRSGCGFASCSDKPATVPIVLRGVGPDKSFRHPVPSASGTTRSMATCRMGWIGWPTKTIRCIRSTVFWGQSVNTMVMGRSFHYALADQNARRPRQGGCVGGAHAAKPTGYPNLMRGRAAYRFHCPGTGTLKTRIMRGSLSTDGIIRRAAAQSGQPRPAVSAPARNALEKHRAVPPCRRQRPDRQPDSAGRPHGVRRDPLHRVGPSGHARLVDLELLVG